MSLFSSIPSLVGLLPSTRRVPGPSVTHVPPLPSVAVMLRWIRLAGWLLFVIAPARATAQVVTDTLVKDIHTGVLSELGASSSPVYLASEDGVVYFRAYREDVGNELWRTDGTVGGTSLVVDLAPGPASSGPSNMTRLGDGRFVFTALSSFVGLEVFVTDGTANGTGLILDVFPGPISSGAKELVSHQGKVFFIADDGVHGEELWRTDGTSQGTKLVVDRLPGLGSGMANGRLLAEGKSLIGAVKSLTGGSGGISLVALTHQFPQKWMELLAFPGLGPSAFFKSHATAGDAAIFLKGSEVWRSDGTTLGTLKIANAIDASMWIVGRQGLAYFGGVTSGTGSEHLMVTDGSTLPPRLVAGAAQGIKGISSTQALPYRGGIVFQAFGGISFGTELYFSDGTKLGTKLVADIVPGFLSSFPIPLGEWKGDLYVLATTLTTGQELFKIDCGTGGSSLVVDQQPGSTDGVYGTTFISSPGAFLFSTVGDHGNEPWATRGTPLSTKELIDLNPAVVGMSSEPADLTRVGNSVFFGADDGIHGRELWRTDGTESGTELWIDLNPGSEESYLSWLVAVGGTLYYTGEVPGLGRELVRTDESTLGGYTVIDLAGPLSSFPNYLAPVGDRLFFSAWDTVNVGRELFVTDGTASGTSLVADLSTKVVSSPFSVEPPFHLTALEEKVFFFSSDVHGIEPWVSDGTQAGTYLLRDINAGSASSIPTPISFYASREVVEMNGEVFFEADAAGFGRELWKSDGTTSGTVMVADVNPGPMGSEPHQLQVVGDHLLFVAKSVATGEEVWRTDGTSAGTSVVDVSPGPASSNPIRLQTIGSQALFATRRALLTGGEETVLHQTDGVSSSVVTRLGTVATVGEALPDPIQWLGSGAHALFVNQVFASGYEFWVTDATASGTVALTEIATGGFSSSPGAGVQLGSKFVFAALDYTHGRELHAFDLIATPAWVAQPIGKGCAGVGGEFDLVPLGEAVIGSSFGLAFTGAPPSSPLLLFASGGLVGPAPMSACILGLVDPIVIASFSSTANGTLSVMAPLPPNPSLVGSLFYLQMAAPLPNGPFQGIATFSAPLEVVVNS